MAINMALILIRADQEKKILNALADLERHAKLKINGKPKILTPSYADQVLESILKGKVRSKTKWAVLVKVEEDTTKSIMQIREIHPPAHVVVISPEYESYSDLNKTYYGLKTFRGYYSLKNRD